MYIMYIYVCGYCCGRYVWACSRAPRVRACVRARACAIGRPRIRAETCERLPVGVDRGWLGAQAFYSASAFNADIGAWNTASVTTLYEVCAAFGPGGAPARAAAC